MRPLNPKPKKWVFPKKPCFGNTRIPKTEKKEARANAPMTETEDTKPTDDGGRRDQRTTNNKEDREKQQQQQQQQKPIPPLHVAARTGDLDALSKLLASADKLERSLNERDFHGRTALHLAAWANQKAVVERLLDVGADVSVGAADGVQAIHFACMKGYLGMCFFPISLTSLTFFVLGIVKALLSRERTNHANVRAKTNKNENCMHFACKSGSVELVEYLAKKNVSVLLKSAKKKYAADMTNKKEILEIVERLKATQEKEEEGKKKRKKKNQEGGDGDGGKEIVVVAEDDAVVLEMAAGPMLPPYLMQASKNDGEKEDGDEKEEKTTASKKQKTKPPIMGLSFGEDDE